MDDEARKEEIIQAMTTVAYQPVLREKLPDTTGYLKLPFGELTALGAGLSSLPACFRTVVNTVTIGGENFFRMLPLPGATGNLQMTNGVTIGNFINSSGRITDRSRFQQIGSSTVTSNMVMPIDPASLFIAAALMSIQKQLNNIQEVQEDILDFLQVDKRAKLQGNISFLTEILNNYKFNWNNDTYKKNMHLKVQDIKQEAEQNILFYRERIKKVLNKRNLLLADQAAKSQLHKVRSDIEDCRLAVYLFGFSSFLEVLLLGNFNEGYLTSIRDKVEDYSQQYRELYTESYEVLEAKLQGSIKASIIKGVATATGIAGKTIAKLPVISKSQIDETLIASGKGLEKFGVNRTQKAVQQLSDSRSSLTAPFISCMNTINRLYNGCSDVLFDRDAIYIGPALE